MSAVQELTADAIDPAKLSRFITKGPRAVSTPPVIVTKAEAVRIPPKFKVMFNLLWEEKHNEAARIVRAIRKARNGDGSIERVTANALFLLRKQIEAEKALKALERLLPANERIEYASVQIGWYHDDNSPLFVSFISDLKNTFEKWIKEAKAKGDPARVSYLKECRARKMRDLQFATAAVVEAQKMNGFWDARIKSGAYTSAFRSLLCEVADCRLTSLSDCLTMMKFIKALARDKYRNYDHDLNSYLLCRMSAHVADRLEIIQRKGVR
jgi:hypothetical protein